MFYAIMAIFIFIVRVFFLPNVSKQEKDTNSDGLSWVENNIAYENTDDDTGSVQEGIQEDNTNNRNIFDINKETCEISSLGDFKYIDVYSEEVRNPEYPNSAYTKKLKITPGFQEAYLCIITNVIESVRLPGKTYYLRVIFGNEEYGWIVNVWKVPNGWYYDYKTSPKNPDLDWRMYGKELLLKDKSYRLDLKQGFKVADKKTYFRTIKPIQKLNWGDTYINVWWNLSNWTDWIIKKFRIFYKWWDISIAN